MAGPDVIKQATHVGLQVQELRRAGHPIPPELQAGYDALDEKIYKLVQGMFGGRLRRAIRAVRARCTCWRGAASAGAARL